MLKMLWAGLFVLLWTLPAVAQAGQVRPMINTLKASPDGKLLAVSILKMQSGSEGQQEMMSGMELQMWELASGRLKWSVPVETQGFPYPQILFAPDSASLLTAGPAPLSVGAEKASREAPGMLILPVQATRALFWNATTGEKLHEVEMAKTDRILSFAFSPDGKELLGSVAGYVMHLAGATAHNVRVWDPRTGKLLRRMAIGEGIPTLMTFADDGRSLQTLTHAGRERGMWWASWSWPDGLRQETRPLPSHGLLIAALAQGQGLMRLRAEGYMIGDRIEMWDAGTNSAKELLFPHGPFNQTGSMELLPDGKTLVVHIVGALSIDGRDGGFLHRDYLGFWDRETGRLNRTLRVGESQKTNSRKYHVAFTPDGKQFVVWDGTDKIELRSLGDGALIRTFEERD